MRFTKRRLMVHDMQYRMLGVSLFHFVLVVAVFAGALFIPLMIEMESDAATTAESADAARQFLTLHYRVWPPLLFTVVLLLLHTTLVSHRIAGPLFRMRRELEAVGEGDLARTVRIRQRDYIEDEAEAINGMIQGLHSRVSMADEGCSRAQTAVARLRSALADGSMQHADNALSDLTVALASASESLADFKLRENDPAPRIRRAQPVVEEPVA